MVTLNEQSKDPATGVKVVKTINLTPTWRGVLPIMVAAIENGTFEGRKIAIEELNRMADLADAYLAEHKKPEAEVTKQ